MSEPGTQQQRVKRSNRRFPVGSDEGAVAVWIALLMVLLISFGAFAVDMGAAYASRRALSVDSDAAALVGARAAADRFGELRPRGGSCTDVESDLEEAATTAVSDFWDTNQLDGAAETALTCEVGGTFLVSVTADTTSPRFLSLFLGSGDLDIAASAAAKVDGTLSVGDLRPLAFCLDDLPVDYAGIGVENTTVFNRDTCGGVATGNFGLVDLENNESDLEDLDPGAPGVGGAVRPWMEDGYQQPIAFPTWFNVQTGASWGGNGFSTLTGKTIKVPLMNLSVAGSGEPNGTSGQNYSYYGVGVMTIRVLSASNQGNTGTLRWVYESQSGSYTPGGPSCIGDAGCQLNFRLWL